MASLARLLIICCTNKTLLPPDQLLQAVPAAGLYLGIVVDTPHLTTCLTYSSAQVVISHSYVTVYVEVRCKLSPT